MGIVVSLAMLVALFMLCLNNIFNKSEYKAYTKFGTAFIVLIGTWNSVWYGAQNLTTFWGVTALLSGVFMLLAAQLIYLDVKKSSLIYHSWYCYSKLVTMVVLGLYFALYVITIVQLNLDMPIIH